MFQDLKEYQDIIRIYNESVNISEEQREINKIFVEAEFTTEEIQYIDKNFDELWESELAALTIESFRQDNLTEEQLNEKLGIEAAKKMAQRGISAVSKRIPQGVKNAASNVKQVAKDALDKAKPAMQKVGSVLAKASLPAAAAVGTFAGIKKFRNKDNKKNDAELQKKIDQGIKDSGMGNNQGTAITQKGREQAAFNRGERKARKDLNDPTLNLTKSEIEAKKKTDPPKATKKMHPLEKKNRARFGDAHVDKLKAKNADFKLMRKGEMSKDDFIKKYPKSITAQKAKGLRDHTEWDAYDMVLEYLFSTEQASTIEEANYIMIEMDQKTIGEIVKEVKSN